MTVAELTVAAAKHQNCAILLAPARPHQPTSRVQSHTCSTRQVDGWATTLYYGENYGLPKYQYAQGVFEAGQIGSPWSNHVWSVWTGYSR